MSEEAVNPVNKLKLLFANLQPTDFIEALGPLSVACVFACVLYAIQVPVMFFVVIGIGLIYWPAYEVMALLIERGMVAVFIASTPDTWERFRNGVFPILFIMVFVGLYFFGQWFWLIIFAQVISLIFIPPAEHQANEGCLHSVITAVLIFIVLVLAAFSVPANLSALFHFPNVGGHLQYLPGMLIIGIGYYLLMAILLVLQKAALRLFEPQLKQ